MTKTVLCASCDVNCMVHVDVPESGNVGDVKVKAMDPRKFHADICIKGIHAPENFSHKKRILKPLKRIGERGSGEWEEVSWDDALDDIATRLQRIVETHGPEALAVSESPALIQNASGMTRRFMNLLGSPNFISGVAVCMGNTSAVNRLTYGWYPMGDFGETNCMVLMGHDPHPHSWTSIYNNIRRAQERGAKLIVVDPRKSKNAELADLWLPIKPGSDAALLFGWLKVILDKELYDKDFAANWTHGFDEFKARIDEFPLERVAKLTGISTDLIAKAARMYADGPSIIPWTPITDQQRNSTSAIRLQSALRALCGNLDVPGGETMQGINPDIISDSEMELHGELPDAQKTKQLGSEAHPVYTYNAMERLREPTKKVWGKEWVNFICGSYMAQPNHVFRAMAGEGPYPVKAFFMLANNPLMSYPNMQMVHKGLMNQDLIVAFEQFRSPSAQLADYILPGDSWLERPTLMNAFEWTCIYRMSQKAVEAPGECRGIYDLWKGLADRMEMGEHFPWETIEDLLDFRMEKLGKTFNEQAAEMPYHFGPFDFKKYETTGFATPTGKVELKSTILEDLGFDPLPYWRDTPDGGEEFPLSMFIGVREDEYFQTAQRQIEKFRKRNNAPRFFVAPGDAKDAGLKQDGWARVVTSHGSVKAKVDIQEEMPKGVVRVPHGWWQPDRPEGDGTLSGAWEFSDSQICPDDDENIDREQGVPQLKGLACRIEQLDEDISFDWNPEEEMAEA